MLSEEKSSQFHLPTFVGVCLFDRAFLQRTNRMFVSTEARTRPQLRGGFPHTSIPSQTRVVRGPGQSGWVLWTATNKLEWDYPADIKTLTIPMWGSHGGSPMESPPPDPEVENVVDDFRLLGGPKAIWARAAAAGRHLLAKGLRAHERRQRNDPQTLVRYETLALGNTRRWVWRHDWTMTLPAPLATALLRMRLDVFLVMQKLKDWRKMDSRTCLLCDSGREETLAHFLVGCDALANTREVTTLIPSHSTLDTNVAPGNIAANTVAGVFRRIREEELSSEEMSQVLIRGAVERRLHSGGKH